MTERSSTRCVGGNLRLKQGLSMLVITRKQPKQYRIAHCSFVIMAICTTQSELTSSYEELSFLCLLLIIPYRT